MMASVTLIWGESHAFMFQSTLSPIHMQATRNGLANWLEVVAQHMKLENLNAKV
jgi:hypothetical protein